MSRFLCWLIFQRPHDVVFFLETFFFRYEILFDAVILKPPLGRGTVHLLPLPVCAPAVVGLHVGGDA